jgi:hypothetical protein
MNSSSESHSLAKKTRSSWYVILAVVGIIVIIFASLFIYMGSCDVSTASSLSFNESIVYPDSMGGAHYQKVFYIKNVGPNMTMRIETTQNGDTSTYILDWAKQEAWAPQASGTWVQSVLNADYWGNMTQAWNVIYYNLEGWNGFGDVSFTSQDGTQAMISSIHVNPQLDDSLFTYPQT